MNRSLAPTGSLGARGHLVLAAALAAVACEACIGAAATAPPSPEREYARLKNRAEALYAEGSYARAQRLYEKAASGDLAEADSRWVAFRVADTMWRAKAVGTGSRQGDNTIFDDARRRLEALIAVVHSPDDRDRVWAEAHESLGDFFWIRRNSQNWSQGWPHYQEALAYWSAARDVELARRRYLHMVWQLAEPPWRLGDRYWGYHNIPLNVLENAKKIARRPQDRARAHFLLAMGLRSYGGSWHQRRRIANEFEAALDLGRNNPWHDDALYHHAEWLANQGRVVLGANGQWRQEPDYVRAVALYRRLLGEYHKGETAYYDDAKGRIRQITAPQLTATVSNIFLPESEIQFDLRWRNLPVIDLAIYRVDLTRDLDPTRTQRTRNQWIEHIDHSTARKIKDWTFRTKDAQKQKHVWGQETSRLETQLPVGAYLLVASGGGITARELILVTDIVIVVKAWSGNVLAWVCDARDGAPIPGARVHLWTMRYLNQRYTGSDTIARTDHEGLARFEVNSSTRPRESDHGFIVTASVDGRQAFGLGPRSSTASRPESWKIYTVTDRPAYRPGETVHFKITARTNDGSGYATPAGEVVGYEITGPRGKVDQGQLPLNVFGSAWSELALSESMTLGEYQISFYNEGRRRTIGSAKLFRLEEYKLPEFTVNVGTPVDEQGRRKKTFRLGDRVEAEIQASYYFGGPVANANVELLVYQKSFQHFWMPPRQYPWYYAHRRHHDYWGGQGQIIQRKTLKTDGAGRVTISFETPVGGSQDFQYTIEARVTDASRREIVGTGTVRVTRQSYYVYPRPRRNVVGPGETVEVDFKSLDPNDEPLAVEGRVTVTRDRWVEVWLDPADREVTGSALARARRRLEVFPPPVKGGERPWRLKFRGYTSQEILTRTIKTSDEGEATLVFAAHDEGYYRIRWRSEEPAPRAAGSAPILAETTVWVADHTTSELGYRSDGVQIIIDTDTFRAGETAAVMLSVPTNDRYVLFAVEGNDMHSYRLVHVTGTVKLIQLPLGQRHIPNVYLQAHMVSDGRLYSDRKEVVVPPVGNFLDLEVRADRDSYEPRDEGMLTVVTRDADGKPVSAEVSLALVDESVFSIQSEYAADPREFFFNDRQGLVVHTASTFSRKRYVRLVKTDTELLIDARLAGGVGDEGDRNQLGMDHLRSGARRARGIAGAYAEGPAEKMMLLEASDDMEPGPMAQATGAAAPSKKPGPPGGSGAGGEPAVVVRSDFRSTILWEPNLITGTDGTATVRVKYGDSLTQWKATARAATTGSRFGIGTTTTRTRRPLIARLQAPRFFVVGDTVTLSGVLNNNTDQPMTVEPLLEVTGLKITGILQGGLLVSATAGAVRVPAGGERRVDWVAVVETPGQAKVRLTARSGGHADAMEKTYTVYEHGVEKLIFSSGKVRGESVTVKLQIPARRKAGSTELVVDVSWSMAVTMLDALPYLVDYPYGCTEQTMSRFLPAVVTAGTLKRMELPVEVALGRVFGGIEERFVDTTHPGGGAKRANLRKLDEIVQSGLERLYDFQHSDGGWGWFKGGESDHFMTAYVLWGMSLARVAERDVRGDAMDRAARFLELQIVEEESRLDMQAWMLHALAAYHEVTKRRIVSAPQRAAFDNLFSGRDRLNTYSLALLALALHHYGDLEKATVLVRNLENGVVRDNTPDRSILLERGGDRQPAVMATAHWGSDGPSWRWSAGAVEATAFALKAILAIDPENELIEPATNWLLKNRRGSQWSNTRDTAIVVLALNDYLQTSGELEPELEYELLVNGRLIARRTIKAADALAAPSRFVIDPALIRDGDNEIRIIRRNGEGPIYFAVRATYFSLEEPIPAAGNEIFVRRDYYKLVPRETLLNGYVYDRVDMRDGDYVTSGERVEVIVTIEAKNDYEYLVFEDLKPAGLEAVQITSGKSLFARQLTSGAVRGKFAGDAAEAAAAVRGPGAGLNGSGHDYTGRRRWVHQELRDRKVVLFVDKLAQGVWEIRYLLRAEVPGQFHALPVLGHAMYVPEIRCNSNEVRITVNDRPENRVIAVGE